ncbi:hypothetical protein BB560_001814 [Smittium megazygosporum]|uniref:Uncharacterized protein n=1 Tax=Smittium megazygosporum TaxID=133381 RepID=A0A2T9ZGI1_9FUNG|nr:hypothetical protein BB560_001814 [Smittium megazygosporum]
MAKEARERAKHEERGGKSSETPEGLEEQPPLHYSFFFLPFGISKKEKELYLFPYLRAKKGYTWAVVEVLETG